MKKEKDVMTEMIVDMFTKTTEQRYAESSRTGKVIYWIVVGLVVAVLLVTYVTR